MPKRSIWRVAQFDTLRLRLIKSAALVVEMKTLIRVRLPTSCPAQHFLRLALHACRASRKSSCGWRATASISSSVGPATTNAALRVHKNRSGQHRWSVDANALARGDGDRCRPRRSPSYSPERNADRQGQALDGTRSCVASLPLCERAGLVKLGHVALDGTGLLCLAQSPSPPPPTKQIGKISDAYTRRICEMGLWLSDVTQ